MDVEVNPLLGSRYYRAPEVMAGLWYECPGGDVGARLRRL